MYIVINKSSPIKSILVPESIDTGANFIIPEHDEIDDDLICSIIPHQLGRLNNFLRAETVEGANRITWIKNKLTCCLANFLFFDVAYAGKMETMREFESSIVATFITSILVDGWKNNFINWGWIHDDAALRAEFVKATKTICREVFHRSETTSFSYKIVRVVKAMELHDYLSVELSSWYTSDGHHERGGFHWIDRITRDFALGDLLYDTEQPLVFGGTADEHDEDD